MKSYTSKQRKPVQFEVDGVVFTTTGGASLLELSEVAKLADTDVADPVAAAAISGFFRSALNPQEYDRFRKHVATHGTDPETLIHIMQDLVEEASTVPLEEPSPSTNGQSSTPSTYRVVSPLGVKETPMADLSPERQAEIREAVERAMTDIALRGRTPANG
jgi:hypothetical protein